MVTNVLRRMWGQPAASRRLGIAFVVGLALLLGHNVVWLAHHQTRLSCSERVCTSPRRLERVAWRSRTPKISLLALYYLLNDRIPHARLTIPSSWRREKPQLEELSRLEVDVSDGELLVAPGYVEQLRRSGARRHRSIRGDLTWARTRPAPDMAVEVEDYVFLFDAATTDYVVAEAPGEGGPIFVMPRSAYAGVAAR
ncbi:MAG TPA: hypothetical protein VKB80_26065 [Kofleriaceae bacterium]|nr:hypothetical protein [Kofleriaceae bacterium]